MSEGITMDQEMDMEEVDRICHNCSSFFMDRNDTELGVCLHHDGPIFESYMDEVCEEFDFSCCYGLYQEKRYSGDREACENFEEPEELDVPEGMDVLDYLHIERMKTQQMDDLTPYLYNEDDEIVHRAVSMISGYVYLENPHAYEMLLEYYLSLEPAKTLEDVSLRMKIIEPLSRHESNRRTIEAYVHELARTPSNNTTRKLYTLLLERLGRCDEEIVQALLIELLNTKKYSYKIKQRIKEVAGLTEKLDDDDIFYYRFLKE